MRFDRLETEKEYYERTRRFEEFLESRKQKGPNWIKVVDRSYAQVFNSQPRPLEITGKR